MDQFILSCCSTADMPESYFKERDIHYICFSFLMDDVLYKDDLGKSMNLDEFYQRMAKGATPTTSQVNVEEFTEYFEEFLKEGKDILHVCLSSGVSGVYNSANLAQQLLSEKYPERKIVIIDSLGASSGYGLLMDHIADIRDNGGTLEDCRDWAEANKLHIHHWFFSTDLTSYWRGGRISRTSATVGTILGLCPLMSMNPEGRLIPRVNIRTKKKAMIETVKRMKEQAKDGIEYAEKCFISHSACYNDAKAVSDLIEKEFPNMKGKVMINSIGTVIGSHTGPGTVAVFFTGVERVE